METRIVAVTKDLVVATSWKALLAEEGIGAEVMGGDLKSVWDGLSFDLASYRLLVREDDAERARAIIDVAERSSDVPQPDDNGRGDA